MKELVISRGLVTLVDDDVYEWASGKRWTAQRRKYTWNVARYEGKIYQYLHRLILRAPNGSEVNHIDGDGLNNCRTNLQLTDHLGNSRAFITLRKGKTSRFRGVWFHKVARKWCATLTINGNSQYLGLFVDEKEAALVRDRAALQHFGAFAHLNFPS